MVEDHGQFDDFERLMLEAADAQRAGVFERTRVDVEALVGEPARHARWYRHILVGLPVAACIAMFFGVATMWRAGSHDGEAGLNGTAVSTFGAGMVSPAEGCQNYQTFRACFGGPGILVGSECRCVDFDRDGDVDLADMGGLQMSKVAD